MNKQFYFLFIAILFSLQLHAQLQIEPKLQANGEYAFVNVVTTQKVNNFTWEEMESFVNGYAKVYKNGKWGFVDTNGNLTIKNEYQSTRDFQNNLAAVQLKGKWGFIDKSGKIIIPVDYDIVYDFKENFTVAFKNSKWVFINKLGQITKQLDVDIFWGFVNGVAKITKNKQEGLMNIKGEIISLNPLKQEIDLSKYSPAYSRPNSVLAAPCPTNIDFESNSFTNWICYKGTVASVGTTNVISVTANVPSTSPTFNRHVVYTRVAPTLALPLGPLDPYGFFPRNPQDGSNFALKLGNDSMGKQAERASYIINVPIGATDVSITYRYAVVFQDPPTGSNNSLHLAYEKPQFTAKLYDVTAGASSSVPCATYIYIASDNLGVDGFFTSTVSNIVRYKPWTSVFVNLSAYAGRTMRLEFTTADCTQGAHWGYAYVDVGDCNVVASLNYSCNPSSVSLLGPPGFQTYNWYNSNYSTILSMGQNPVLTPAPAPGTILHVEVIPFSGSGCKDTLDVVVTNSNALVNAGADKLICKNESTTIGTAAIAGLTYSWSPAANLSDPNAATPTANPLVTTTYYLTASGNNICPTVDSVVVIVKPDPDILQPTDKTFCSGANSTAINFASNIAGTTYTWANSNTAIGLAASGTGNIASFVAINNTTTAITATITVLPTANSCIGFPKTFLITVNPSPTVIQPTDQTLCNGATTVDINFTGAFTGTVFNWTNNNTNTGLAASGTGNIPSFIATNNTATLLTSTIIITPTVGVCVGVPKSFTINVNPSAIISPPTNQTFCNGSNSTPINITGPVAGTSFSWVNDNTTIGLAASGIGNIPTFVAANNTNAPITSIITVNASAGVCASVPKTFLITVNPTSVINQPADVDVCNGASATPISFSSSVIGTTYSWTNNNTTIGLAASGTGAIPTFIATNNNATISNATVTVTPIVGLCASVPKTFLIKVKPSPIISQPTDQSFCNGSNTTAISFNSTISGTTYSWVNSNTTTGLAANGNGNIPSFIATNNTTSQVTSSITVTPTTSLCAGLPKIFLINVNPTAVITPPNDQTFCNGTNTSPINFAGAVTGTTYSWTNSNTTIGLAANGTGNIPSFFATNSTIAQTSATITVTPTAGACAGLAKIFLIKINPTPIVGLPIDQTLCNGSNTNPINFSSSISNTTYNWSNSNTSVGLGTTGFGNIPSFIATNNTASQISTTITVTPIASACAGLPKTFLLYINPTATINQTADQIYCNGTNTTAINFSGAVLGTTYNWVNSNTTIGLGASGAGNVPSFVATNNTNAPISSSITVTAIAGVCASLPKSFLIKVNPTPNLTQPVNQTICNGSLTAAINFNSSVIGSTFSWVNSNSTIGFPANGNGDIPSFVAINNTGNATSATITVTPFSNGCGGIAKTFVIQVNPTFKITTANNPSICRGSSIPINAQGGQNYQWMPSIGLSCNNCANPVASPIVTTTYNVNSTPSSGCLGNTVITITVHQPIQIIASPNRVICNKDTVNLFATGASTYLWSPAPGLSSTTSANPVATPNTTTQYKVIGYDNNNCFTDTKYVMVIVNPAPTIQLGPDKVLNTGTLFPLNPIVTNGPITSWVWTPTTDLSCIACPNPTATIKKDIRYTAVIKNIFGCVATDDINITTLCEASQVFVPNAFTPDGDGKNDILMVRSKGVGNIISFKIYSRWGELIFEKNNFPPNNPAYGWDGKYKGKVGPAEVYVYMVEVKCDNDQNYFLKGNISILK